MIPSRADYFNAGAREILTRSAARPIGQRITAAAIYTRGSDVNVMLAAGAAMADESSRALAARLSALYLNGAQNEDLDRLVADRFSPTVVRKQATSSLVTLRFTRSNLVAGSLSVGTRIRTLSGIEYATLGIGSFELGSTGPIDVLAQATLAGASGNVDAGLIVQFVQPPFDDTIQVTNPQVAAGGSEVESNASLRARARDFFRTARRGTVPAIEFGALTVEGVARATAVELLDTHGEPSGFVQVYVADSNGQANDALIAAVRLALVEYRCAGVVPDILATVPVYQAIQYRLRYRPNVNIQAAQAQIRFLTVAEVNALRPGEILTMASLTEIARVVPGVLVYDDAVPVPGGDVVPLAGQILRTSSELVSFAA